MDIMGNTSDRDTDSIEKTQNISVSKTVDEEKISINSILKSSLDSCHHLDIDRKSINGSQMSDKITNRSEWQSIK